MPIDWGALFNNLLEATGTIITSIVTAISSNAEAIAGLIIGTALITVAVAFGKRIFRGLTEAIGELIPS
jgi:phage tail tape-measure protein